MSEYTPTTDEIREYIETGGEPRPWVELDEAEKAREKARVAAFDRWLAAHDAEKDETIAELRLELAKQEDCLALARFDTDELHRIRAGVVTEEPEGPTSMKPFHREYPGLPRLFHTYCSEHPDFGTCEEEVQAHRDIADHLASEHYEVKQEEAEDA